MQRLDLIELAGVAGKALGADRLRRGARQLQCAARDGDRRAFLGKPFGDAEAEALARAEHQGALAFQTDFHAALSRVSLWLAPFSMRAISQSTSAMVSGESFAPGLRIVSWAMMPRFFKTYLRTPSPMPGCVS